MKTYIKILLLILSLFFIYGAFFVNFPAGNIGWGVYDLLLAVVIGFVALILNDF